MTSTSPTGHYPTPSQEDRIRRNVACVSCRNSKVRCRTSKVPGEPCQRCAKLDILCIVDKSHKRTTKRSKLEQLEQELESIKQAVNPRVNADHLRSPRANYTSYQDQPRPSTSQKAVLQPKPNSLPDQSAGAASLNLAAKRPSKATPSQPRTLGFKIVNGTDIDWYFDKYFECFHSYVPILRKKDPDECYECCPTLFWVIIYIACRRYSQNPELFNTLIESLSKDIWMLLSNPVMSFDAVHAILLICAYPLPIFRFTTDPSTTFAGIAMNICMLMGLHTGKGSHQEFCVGSRETVTSTDEEASATWILACILAQRSASCMGHPPPSIQLNDAPARRALATPEYTDLLIMFDIQKFLNRMHNSMATHIASNGWVVESLVMAWEDEFETIRPIISRNNSNISRFMVLATKQEIQTYYFTHNPEQPGPNLPINALRAFNTSKSLISTTNTTFIAHAPNWAFRSLLDAACLITSSMHSTTPPTTPDATRLVQLAHAAVRASSVSEADLPARGAAILEMFWAARDVLARTEYAARAWPNRLGAGLTFWCLQRFNQGLKQAKVQSEEQVAHPMRTQNNAVVAENDSRLPGFENLVVDPFQDIDWSMFMDDF